MCDIIDAFVKEGKDAGIALGMAKGTKQGQAKINRLIQLLAAQDRISDIIRSANDPAYQNKLLKEFGL